MNFCEVVARIARVLGHGCAPDPAVAAECTNFYTLSALMRYVGRKANASDKEAWQHGLEGWNEEGGDHNNPFKLFHVTGTGRLSIECVDSGRWGADARTPARSITLEFQASGDRMVAILQREREQPWRILALDSSLIVGREDRLALLADIDRELGGEIVEDLSLKEGFPIHNVPILLALERLREQEEEARQATARQFRAIESCIDEGCRCDDRAGVVLYDGPEIDEARQAEQRARSGYHFLVKEFVDGKWVEVPAA